MSEPQPLDPAAVAQITTELLRCVRAHYLRRPTSRATAQEVLNVVATIFAAARACGDEAGAREFFALALEQQLAGEALPTSLAELMRFAP